MGKNIFKKTKSAILISTLLYLGMFGVSYAASDFSCNLNASSFRELVKVAIYCIANPLTVLLVSVSTVVFVWGVFKYFISDADKKQESREFMLYGIVGLFVMVSMWGIVAILKDTFNFSDTKSITPQNVTIPPLKLGN